MTTLKNELPLDPKNPSPFVQPFLHLMFDSGEMWDVDVNGAVELYVKDPVPHGSHYNLIKATTSLMRGMIKIFKKVSGKVIHVGLYKGSAGPTHILRNGAIFKRVKLDKPI